MTEVKLDFRFNKQPPKFDVVCYAVGYAVGNAAHVELIISSDEDKLTILLDFDDYEKLKELLGEKSS